MICLLIRRPLRNRCARGMGQMRNRTTHSVPRFILSTDENLLDLHKLPTLKMHTYDPLTMIPMVPLPHDMEYTRTILAEAKTIPIKIKANLAMIFSQTNQETGIPEYRYYYGSHNMNIIQRFMLADSLDLVEPRMYKRDKNVSLR